MGPIAAYQGALIRELGDRSPAPPRSGAAGSVARASRLSRRLSSALSTSTWTTDCAWRASTAEVDRYERLSGMSANVVGPLLDFLRAAEHQDRA